jgi:hypothetical protein
MRLITATGAAELDLTGDGGPGALAAGLVTRTATDTLQPYVIGLSAVARSVVLDAQQRTYTASIAAGSTSLALTGGGYPATTAAGKTIIVPGIGTGGIPLTTTVVSSDGAGNLVLQNAAVTAIAAVATMVTWGTDTTVALNAWLAELRTSKQPGYLPAGCALITDTLVVTPPSTTGTWAVTVRGAGYGYLAETFQQARTISLIIAPGLVDRPMLAVSSARTVVLTGFGLIGPNVQPRITGYPGSLMSDDQTIWLSPGCRADRYSPQCAIAIDPYRASGTPAGGGYPGATYASNYVPSSTCRFEELDLWNHVVGIMNTPAPSPAGAQGDTMMMRDIIFFGMSECYASGQVQTRACVMDHCVFGNYRTILDGLTYGDRTGAMPSIDQSAFGWGWMAFRVNPNYSDINFNSVYSESCMHLGFAYATGGLQSPLRFSGMTYSRRGDTANAVAAPLILESSAPVVWNGYVQDATPLQIPALGQNVQDVHNFIGAPFHWLSGPLGANDADKAMVGAAWFNQDNVRVTDMAVAGLGAGNARKYAQVFSPPFGASGRYNPQQMCYQNDIRTPTGVYHYSPASSNGLLSLAGGSPVITNPGGQTMTFTMSATFVNYLRVGDILPWQVFGHQGSPSVARRTYLVPAYKVTGIAGTTVTCTALFAAAGYYDTGYGTISLVMPEWGPMQALTGDTHTNTTLDNLNLTTILKAGDFILGTGIPAFTRVASIAGAVATLTQAATATAVGVTLYYGRLKVPTLTAAF